MTGQEWISLYPQCSPEDQERRVAIREGASALVRFRFEPPLPDKSRFDRKDHTALERETIHQDSQ